MSSDTLTIIIIYYALTTVVGGFAMSWYFTTLKRDALAGAFIGFGAALLGFGLIGLGLVWNFTSEKQIGLTDVGVLQEERQGGFKLSSDVAWGMGAFAFMWILLILLALNTEPSRFLIVVSGGLYEGMLIFLVASGLSIIFGLMDVLNLAQGAFFTVGAYVTWGVYTGLDSWRGSVVGVVLALLIALVAATIVGAIIGYFTERFLIRPTYSRPFFQIVLTFGLAEVMRRMIIAQYGVTGRANIDLHLADESSTFLTGLFPRNIRTKLLDIYDRYRPTDDVWCAISHPKHTYRYYHPRRCAR